MTLKAFKAQALKIENTVRSIYQSCWSQISPSFYLYTIQGSGFLKQMVRNIVGTYMGLLKEENPEKKFKNILLSRDRKKALKTAPGKGLYLKKVFYPRSIDKECIEI